MEKRSLAGLRMDHRPKLSQARLAQIVQRHLPKGRTISTSRIWQIENDLGSVPDTIERRAIAKGIGVPVDSIAWTERQPVGVRAKAS